MPKFTSSNPDAKFCYINGHYCHAHKTAIVTNALGVVCHVDFYDDNSLNPNTAKSAHESKYQYDTKSLIPVIDNFFSLHPGFSLKYFLGDSDFDASDNYRYLFKEHGIIPIIPLNYRNSKYLPQPDVASDGIPTCPYDPSLKMKYDGITREKGRAARIKWLCPILKRLK